MPDEEEPLGRTHVRGAEDAEQAQWLAEEFDRGVRYDHTAKRWHIWNGVRWAPDQTRVVQQTVMDLTYERLKAVAVAPNMSDKRRMELMKVYRRLLETGRTETALVALSTMVGYKTDGADWDQNPYLLGCENGIIDLRTNALIPKPTPDLLVSMTTGHNFVPLADGETFEDRAPRFMAFLDEVTSGDPALSAFYLLWFGYSLFGVASEQRFLILTGLGRNGKGALVTAMRHVFGEYSASADSSLYMRSRYGAARSDGARADLMALRGKRLAVMSEPDGGAFNEEMLKAHTGGDPITARALHSNNVLTWTPTHSITFLTNEPPRVNDVGVAMAARVMVADFRERFDGAKEDKKLYAKLEAEAEGILAILVFFAKAWYDSETGLTLPARIEKASAEYLSSNDPIGHALDEAFIIDHAAKTAGKVLYDAYVDWHNRSDHDEEPLSMTGFLLALKKRGFSAQKTKNANVYLGIRPASALETAEQDDDDE